MIPERDSRSTRPTCIMAIYQNDADSIVQGCSPIGDRGCYACGKVPSFLERCILNQR